MEKDNRQVRWVLAVKKHWEESGGTRGIGVKVAVAGAGVSEVACSPAAEGRQIPPSCLLLSFRTHRPGDPSEAQARRAAQQCGLSPHASSSSGRHLLSSEDSTVSKALRFPGEAPGSKLCRCASRVYMPSGDSPREEPDQV